MAYVRQHGNQIAIVSGDRDKETGNVQQRILFTFYSRDEAMAAIGTGLDDRKHLFQSLMQDAYPSSKFDWEKINTTIAQKLDVLPEHYEDRTTECSKDMAASIVAVTRNLVLADPHWIPSAKQVLRSQESSLIALRELVDHTLTLIDFYGKHDRPEETEGLFFQKDTFNWRYMLRGSEVPQDLEEWAEGFYERQEYAKAEAIFGLLVQVFGNYAEGHNYLGLIALEQRQYQKAVGHFEKTVEIGRNLFPRRLPKKDYWFDLSTRPFMRGIKNLVLSLLSAGEYQRALPICDRLEKECGDKHSANAYRASIYLNLGDWQSAGSLSVEDDFIKAFAYSEEGNKQKALECFLLDAVESPHTARLLLNMKKPKPDTYAATEDHNTGLHLVSQLQGYFDRQSAQSEQFFNALAKEPAFIEMLKKLDRHTYNHSNGDREKHDENFKEWHDMKDRSYVKLKAKELLASMSKSTLKSVK